MKYKVANFLKIAQTKNAEISTVEHVCITGLILLYCKFFINNASI